MSIEQRKMLITGGQWAIKIVFGVIGWFLINSFLEVKQDIKEIKGDVKQIEGRVIRVETKIFD